MKEPEPTSVRSLTQILYGRAALRPPTLKELSEESAVILLLVEEIESARNAIEDLRWLQASSCAAMKLVIVHTMTDAAAETALRGCGDALRISDPERRFWRAFEAAEPLAPSCSQSVSGPFLIVRGQVLSRAADATIHAA